MVLEICNMEISYMGACLLSSLGPNLDGCAHVVCPGSNKIHFFGYRCQEIFPCIHLCVCACGIDYCLTTMLLIMQLNAIISDYLNSNIWTIWLCLYDINVIVHNLVTYNLEIDIICVSFNGDKACVPFVV